MKIYTFTTKNAGNNIYASHINDIQSAINELSTELTEGIGSVSGAGGGKTFKFAASTESLASINLPSGTAPSTPNSGDAWNASGKVYFYDGSSVKTLAFQESPTLASPTVSGLYLSDSSIVFEGSSADDFETTLTVTNPTADRTITLPNISGTVVTTGDTGTLS